MSGGAVRISAIEALTNSGVGLVLSWCITYFALPLWGLHPSATASASITACYFFVSFARAFIIREVFRKWVS